MFLSTKLCFLLVVFLAADFTNGASLSKTDQKIYQPFLEGQGLYVPSDDVEILTAKNFKRKVFNQSNAWIVEFYNSWCGFCQRFAPSWKALGTDMKLWKNMINVGVIDCSNEENSPLCREFDIMGYPLLRYFHEYYANGVGTEVKKGSDMEEHKKYILKHMIEEQNNGRGKQFPNLKPYTHSTLKHLFDEVPVNSKYAFIVIDDDQKMLGPQLELDFGNVKDIGIRYATSNNTGLMKAVNADKVPFMMVVTDTNRAHSFPTDLDTREALRNAIVEYVKPDVKIDFLNTSSSDLYTGKWIDAPIPDLESLMEARSSQLLRQKVKELGDTVYMADLIAALKYSLTHDVARWKDINGPKLQALRNYVSVLHKYFPYKHSIKEFLMELSNLVNAHSSIDGLAIVNLVKRYEADSKQVFSIKQRWMGCEGSTSEKRGYPCGLWTLFHYLTVSANEDTNDPLSRQILPAMHGYIKNFFGCDDCSKHFQDMALRKNIEGVQNTRDAVLWLWAAHNEVNQRLAGDQTEDPEHPKIQFPSGKNCPDCKDASGTWDKDQVLGYLKNMYGHSKVNYLGWYAYNPEVAERTTTSSFEQLDASMCFFLYVISFFLIAILIRLFLKQGYRKKMYAHDLLGKV